MFLLVKVSPISEVTHMVIKTGGRSRAVIKIPALTWELQIQFLALLQACCFDLW